MPHSLASGGQPGVSQSHCRILAASTAPGTCQERGQSLLSEGRNTSFALPTQAATDPELSTTGVCRLAPSVLGPHCSLPLLPPWGHRSHLLSSAQVLLPSIHHPATCPDASVLAPCLRIQPQPPSGGFKTPTPNPSFLSYPLSPTGPPLWLRAAVLLVSGASVVCSRGRDFNDAHPSCPPGPRLAPHTRQELTALPCPSPQPPEVPSEPEHLRQAAYLAPLPCGF